MTDESDVNDLFEDAAESFDRLVDTYTKFLNNLGVQVKKQIGWSPEHGELYTLMFT